MFQIVEAITTTITRLIDQHGSKIVLGVVALVAAGVALKMLLWAASSRGPKDS